MKRIILFIFGVFVLTGCSTQESSKTTSDTFTYASVKGDVELPTDPKRIVTDGYVGQLLSINAPVVGGDLTYISPAWDGLTDDITNIGSSLEEAAALSPDLIITWNEAMYEQYQSIAPTVLIPYGTYNEEDMVTELGKITDRNSEAEELLNKFNDKVEDLRSVLSPDYTYSIVELSADDAYLYGNTYARLGYVLYDKLNLKCPEACEKDVIKDTPDGASYLQLSEELMDKYIGDVIILSSPNANSTNKLIESDTYKNLDAVKNKRVINVDSDLFYQNDMLSIFDQIDEVKEGYEQTVN